MYTENVAKYGWPSQLFALLLSDNIVDYSSLKCAIVTPNNFKSEYSGRTSYEMYTISIQARTTIHNCCTKYSYPLGLKHIYLIQLHA